MAMSRTRFGVQHPCRCCRQKYIRRPAWTPRFFGQIGGPPMENHEPPPNQPSMPLQAMPHRPNCGGERQYLATIVACRLNVPAWCCSADVATPRLRRLGRRLRCRLRYQLQHRLRLQRLLGVALGDRGQLAMKSASAPVECNSCTQHLPAQNTIA